MTTLADSEITISWNGERIILRPTLRAAMRLERRFDGFDNLLRGIAEQNTGVMAALIEECAEYPRNGLTDFLAYDTRQPMAYKLASLVEPLMALVMALAGVDYEDVAVVTDSDDRVAYAEHFERLFKLATGYLGWSPDEAWSATPGEIKAAYEGRLDMLKAIFGTSEEKQTRKKSPAAFAAFLLSKANN